VHGTRRDLSVVPPRTPTNSFRCAVSYSLRQSIPGKSLINCRTAGASHIDVRHLQQDVGVCGRGSPPICTIEESEFNSQARSDICLTASRPTLGPIRPPRQRVPGGSFTGRNVKLFTHLHPVRGLRIHGYISPFLHKS
jgi:hypothetical protein